MKSRAPLVASPGLCHLGCAAAAEAPLQRDAEAAVPIALASLVENEVLLRAVRPEEQSLAVAARVEQIVDVEGDCSARPRTKLDEGRPIGASVEVRVVFVGPVEGEALVVVDGEPVGPFAGIAAHVDIPLPTWEETAPLALLMVDRVFDASALEGAAALDPEPAPEPGEGQVDGQLSKIARAGAKVARCVEEALRDVVEYKNPVLKQAHLIVTDVELDEAVAE